MTIQNDDEMRAQVLEAIESLPAVKPGDYDVYVNAGVVTLVGRVDSHKLLFDIETRVSKVSGIHGLLTYIQSDVDTAREQRRTVSERRSTVSDRRHPHAEVMG
jgi:osmotically-inducible protein OsmY